MKKNVLLFLIFISLQFSCNEGVKENKKIAAKVNGSEIYLSDADNYVRFELYDALQKIYVLRKAATDELINNKIFQLEASEQNYTVEQYLNNEIYNKVSDSAVNKFISFHKLDSIGMPSISNGYKIVFPNSIEGKLMAKQEYIKNLRNDLLARVKNKYKSEVLISPPLSPKMNTDDLPVVHYRGNLKSKISFLIISDFTCESCQASYSGFEKIFEKYKDKVKFGFTHFSPEITLASICAEAANRQNKFWEFYKMLFGAKYNLKDTVSYFEVAKKTGMNLELFKADIKMDSIHQSIINNIDFLKRLRVYATPTVVLNGSIVLDIHDQDRMEKLLLAEINK